MAGADTKRFRPRPDRAGEPVLDRRVVPAADADETASVRAELAE
jgi:hypothetical protein